MLRAMTSAVAGLRAHQNKLDVIGNNIANVNTYGYKTQNYTFKEAMYQTSTSSTAGTTGQNASGGTNAAQYGYGTMMGTISTDMTSSTPSYIGGFTASIDGQGFFVTLPTLKEGIATDSATLKSQDFDYTRVGMFNIDSNGYMVDSNGNFVYGFRAKNPIAGGEVEERMDALRVPSISAETTTTTTDNQTLPTTQPSNNTAADGTTTTITRTESGDTVTIVTKVEKSDGSSETTTDVYTKEANAATYKKDTTVVKISPADYTNGNTPVLLSNVTINSTGEITGTIDSDDPALSGMVISLGKVAIATFQNVEGMTKKGDIYYGSTTGDNSGQASASISGGNTPGLMTGYVEASNVDLAKEFSDMITAQRGFQANSKIITVSDEILQELINMKR